MSKGTLTADFLVMASSLLLVIASMIAISHKEKSWINWYTLFALQTVGMLYILPGLFMLSFGPSGSLSAYSFCYATYALMSLCSAAGYCLLRPVTLRRNPVSRARRNGACPWLLLLSGLLLYLPVLRAFTNSLFQPRDIYAGFSAAGYGINFFGSTVLITLAFILYLFKAKTNLIGAVVFFLTSAVLIYLHGSKGQFIVLGFIAILYRIYVGRRKASLLTAGVTVASITILAGLLFAAFGSVSDLTTLAMDMANYSDGGRNAMMVIDDPRRASYLGQLELEDEVYSRMPRLLIPNKPRVFGQVRLARRYYPEWFRDSAGTPSFGIGMQYADFGPISSLLLSVCSLVTGWLARSVVVALRTDPSPGGFLLLLFFAGVSVIPLGAGYLLPETLVLAIAIDWFQTASFTLIKSGDSARTASTAAAT